LEVLFEGEVPDGELPTEIAELYSGGLGFDRPVVYSNFVESVDGVVALESRQSSGSIISGHDPADRFLMALLRACADAVIVGAGTLRATPNHRWVPEHIYPDLAVSWAELRRQRGLAPEPRLVLVSGSGDIDPEHPGVQAGALVLTTSAGADRLGDSLPATCEVRVVGAASVDLGPAVEGLQREGMATILTEGGPTIIGELLDTSRLGEVFVTVAPVLAGRDGPGRLGMVEGTALLPERHASLALLSARRRKDMLFLRYRLAHA
jgi:riboflavin biosynthesis pyrimidine reductase